MASGLGIAGIIILMISFGIPIIGNFITLLALVIVAIGALFGDRAYAIATTVIAAVKLLLLSPTWMIVLYSSTTDLATRQAFWGLTIVFLALPIVAIIVRLPFGGRDDDD